MRLLLISYQYKPDSSVGSHRFSYFADYFSTQEDCSVTVITATAKADTVLNNYQVLVVPPANRRYSILPIKDAGLNWRHPLQIFLNQHLAAHEYDFVLFTGSPFMHFSVARHIKSKFKIPIVLDFRDPFAFNPAMKSGRLRNAFKHYLQHRYIRSADVIITVNNVCKEILSKRCSARDTAKIHVIANGYNDFVKVDPNPKIRPAGKKTMVYAGQITDYRSPKALLSFLNSPEAHQWTLVYIGTDGKKLAGIDNLIDLGRLSYQETLNTIAACDVGLILSSGLPFESTTKVYDYIYLNRPILVITPTPLTSGGLVEILRSYPNVQYCGNDGIDLKAALFRLTTPEETSRQKFDSSLFSRRFGANSLLNLLRLCKNQ